jgi:hypothetical protein
MSTYQIAIDPGVHTGLAVAKDGVLIDVRTCSFWVAHWQLSSLHSVGEKVELIIEDPRGIYVPPGQRNPQRIKGVGSVERDAKLWIEYAEHYGIPYRTVKPGKYRKIDADTFRRWTGWTGRTSEHARAAAMMVWNGKIKQG